MTNKDKRRARLNRLDRVKHARELNEFVKVPVKKTKPTDKRPLSIYQQKKRQAQIDIEFEHAKRKHAQKLLEEKAAKRGYAGEEVEEK